MSFSGTPPGARVGLNEPSADRVKIAPEAVVNQKREADWYSIAVMFEVVPLGISVQTDAEAGEAKAANAATPRRRVLNRMSRENPLEASALRNPLRVPC